MRIFRAANWRLIRLVALSPVIAIAALFAYGCACLMSKEKRFL